MNLGKMAQKLSLMVGRAIIKLTDDAKALQMAQISALADEAQDDVEVFGHYGLASRPKPGAEAIFLSVAGVRSHSVIIATEDRNYRMTALEDGEVALYDDLGQKVHLTRDGIVILTDMPVEITASEVNIHCNTKIFGDLEITGTATADVDVFGGGKSLKTHKHTGVTAGAAQTGAPA